MSLGTRAQSSAANQSKGTRASSRRPHRTRAAASASRQTGVAGLGPDQVLHRGDQLADPSLVVADGEEQAPRHRP